MVANDMAVLAVGAPDKCGAIVVGLFGDDMRGPVPAWLASERQLVRGSVVLRSIRIRASLHRWAGVRDLGFALCGLRRTLRGGGGGRGRGRGRGREEGRRKTDPRVLAQGDATGAGLRASRR